MLCTYFCFVSFFKNYHRRENFLSLLWKFFVTGLKILVATFCFLCSVCQILCVSVDISLNIRGYFITYPRIFHHASAVTRVFCFVLTIYWLYAFVFSHMDWHKFFCSDLLSEVTHTGKHYRKKKSKKRFFRWKLSNFLTLLAERGSKKPLFLKKSLGRSQTESSGETKKWFHISLAYSYLYGYAKKVLALAEKNKKLFLYFARLFVPLWPKSWLPLKDIEGKRLRHHSF